jgi:TRAP-type mannitol/chloroaromatic compound transport system permease small subunit
LVVHRRLNYAQPLGASYCFEAGMSVKLCENVFDVIIHRSRANVEFISNCFVLWPFARLLRSLLS